MPFISDLELFVRMMNLPNQKLLVETLELIADIAEN